MQKRKIMIPLKPPTTMPVEKQEIEEPKQDLDEEKIFKTKKKGEKPPVESLEIENLSEPLPPVQEEEVPVKVPVPEIEAVKPAKRPVSDARREHLAKCREISLEKRRMKAREKAEMKARIDAELDFKYRKMLEDETRLKRGLPPLGSEAEKKEPALPPPPPIQAVEPMRSASVAVDTKTQVLNYDEITEKVYSKFKSDQTMKQLELDIRREEQMKAQKQYEDLLKKYEEDQHRKYQRDMGYSMMGGKINSVFRRTEEMRSRQKSRFGK